MTIVCPPVYLTVCLPEVLLLVLLGRRGISEILSVVPLIACPVTQDSRHVEGGAPTHKPIQRRPFTS